MIFFTILGILIFVGEIRHQIKLYRDANETFNIRFIYYDALAFCTISLQRLWAFVKQS